MHGAHTTVAAHSQVISNSLGRKAMLGLDLIHFRGHS